MESRVGQHATVLPLRSPASKYYGTLLARTRRSVLVRPLACHSGLRAVDPYATTFAVRESGEGGWSVVLALFYLSAEERVSRCVMQSATKHRVQLVLQDLTGSPQAAASAFHPGQPRTTIDPPFPIASSASQRVSSESRRSE